MRWRPAEERFWEKVQRAEDGCWLWTSYTDHQGRPRLQIGRKSTKAYRFAYELLVGPVPDGMVLDHTCHNADASCPGGSTCLHRRCVNPAHLQLATSAENTRRGRTGAHWRAKTHCPAGHPYDEANTRYKKRPHGGGQNRVCRACERAYGIRRRSMT